MTDPGVLIGEWKKFAVMKESGNDLPDIGIGDRKSDHYFMYEGNNSRPRSWVLFLIPPGFTGLSPSCLWAGAWVGFSSGIGGWWARGSVRLD
ncbi:hypothetical protein R6Q59_027237 [Mikania micrantha]